MDNTYSLEFIFSLKNKNFFLTKEKLGEFNKLFESQEKWRIKRKKLNTLLSEDQKFIKSVIKKLSKSNYFKISTKLCNYIKKKEMY